MLCVKKTTWSFLKTICIRTGQRKYHTCLQTTRQRKQSDSFDVFLRVKYGGRSKSYKLCTSHNRMVNARWLNLQAIPLYTVTCPDIYLCRNGWLNCSNMSNGIVKGKQGSFHTTTCKWRDSDTFIEDLSDDDLDLLHDPDYSEHVKEINDYRDRGHHVLIIHPDIKGKDSLTTADLQLEEACSLINTLQSWTVADKMIYPVGENRQFIFGKRQMKELTGFIRVNRQKITAVFLNVDILKINQLALFKNTWKVPVLDRYSIVLQIFKEHANTKIAKIQVALAELPYLRNRLIETDESYQKGPYSTLQTVQFGGFKSSYIHMTDIMLSRRERKLRAALEKLKQHRNLLWSKRHRKDVPTIAIVGYTNSGKTTLIKALTGDERVEPCNQLFATLDVTVHAGRLDNHMTVLFIDTIGFISNLPMDLLGVFSATLQDVLLADVILHVRDISHPDSENQYANVMSTLQNILPPEKMENVVVVCNKTDLIGDPSNEKGSDNEDMFISAVTGLGLDDLKNKLQTSLLQSCDLLEKKFRVPFDGEHLSDPSNEKGSDNEDMFISAVTGLGLDDLKNKLQTSLLQSCDLLEKKFRVPFDGEHLSDPSNEKGSDNEDMFISAVTGLGLDDLKNKLQTSLLQSCDLLEKKFRVPFDGEHLSWLYKEATVTSTEVPDTNDSLIVHTIISKTNYQRFRHRFGRKKKS